MKEFWDKYVEDELHKEKTLEPIIKNIEKIFTVKNIKTRRQALALILRGYFDDLLEYCNQFEEE